MFLTSVTLEIFIIQVFKNAKNTSYNQYQSAFGVILERVSNIFNTWMINFFKFYKY